MPSHRTSRNPAIRPAFVCGAVLLLATFSIAQHALDANLRVGSGGYNRARAPQVKPTRSPYSVGRTGEMVYNRSAAFNDTTYNRPFNRHQQRIGNIDPKPLTRNSGLGTTLVKNTYSPGHASRRATMPTTRVRSVHHAAGSATMQRSGYRPNRNVSAMQAPTLSISKQAYSATGMASRPVRSR